MMGQERPSEKRIQMETFTIIGIRQEGKEILRRGKCMSKGPEPI
jgi:hypothetical protein